MKILKTFLLILITGMFLSVYSQNNLGKSNVFGSKYDEPYRPLIHFTPQAHWMNDPNGLVFYKGEYHLFYQYYPDSTIWGPMHWGHAVSTDLFHCQHLSIALYPDDIGYIFSGSAVIDTKNSSGFGKADNPPMVAIYAYHSPVLEKQKTDKVETVGIAYSLDKGRNWKKYTGNPVISNPGIRDFRDPKVSWNKETSKWILTLATGDCVSFYSSSDLKKWTLESTFGKGKGSHGGVWECPDLINMPVVNAKNETKWLLLVSLGGGPNGGSATQYFTGDFDGHKFVSDNDQIRWIDYGKDNYAGVTFSGIPQTDGRCIFIGWMSNWQYGTSVPTSPWRSAMTIPRELTLMKEDGKYTLITQPVKEIQGLRGNLISIKSFTIKDHQDLSTKIPFKKAPMELIANFSLPPNNAPDEFGFELSNSMNEKILVGFNNQLKKFIINRLNPGIIDFSKDFPGVHVSGEIKPDSVISMHLIVDVASVELFAQSGKVVMTEIFFPTQGFDKLSVYSKNGIIKCNDISIYPLKNVWSK